MTDRGRLLLGVGLALAGGVIVIVSSRMPWASVRQSGSTVYVPVSGSNAIVGNGVETTTLGAARPWLTAIGASLVALPVLSLLVGPRGRRLVFGLLAIAGIAGTLQTIFPPRLPPGARTSGGATTSEIVRAVAIAGASLAALGGVSGLGPAGRVPSFRIPETGPSDVPVDEGGWE